MPSKTVKTAILTPALRAIGQATQFKSASDTDYVETFNLFVEMLEFWKNDRGIVLYAEIPQTMEYPVGSDDPVQALKENLILAIADNFMYEPTQTQKNNAARSYRVIAARSRGPALMRLQPNQPRGSGNTWYNMPYGDCTSNNIVTETNVQVLTDE